MSTSNDQTNTSEPSSTDSAKEPEPATKVTIIRNPAKNAPVITRLSVSRGDNYVSLDFPLGTDEQVPDSFELSIDDAKQALEPQRVEIEQGEGQKPLVDYIAGFIVSPHSRVRLN